MKTKLELEVNSRAINDPTRKLAQHGVLITPPIDEDFWLFRVKVSEDQAIVGFPKFGVVGVGFAKEADWNTNLPSGTCAVDLYDHISHNKGDAKIPRGRCIEAILMIQKAVLDMKIKEYAEKVSGTRSDSEKLKTVCEFLRRTGSYQVAEAAGH